LFALKPFSLTSILRKMAPRLDGFAVSSLFEGKLARRVLGGQGTIHLTTPGLPPSDAGEIGTLCDFVAFNSLSQRDTYYDKLGPVASCGLRVNPQMSFVEDERYDPCRPASKLGVPLDELARVARLEPQRLDGVEGLLVHSNCESTQYEQLRDTVRLLHNELDSTLQRMRWVNLGGGYMFDGPEDLSIFCEAVDFLHNEYGLQVYIEPGAAFIQSAGYIVSTVLDIFQNEGQQIAVLDTTVNHMPEVFEYEYEPDVIDHTDGAPFQYLLAGCTCLAGDLFGEYNFGQPLEVGSRVVFKNMGAYTLSKAHTFNGVNLPDIYTVTEDGNLELHRRFTYADYSAKWGGDANIAV
jgi:carboxynorspermidine decarboxylase